VRSGEKPLVECKACHALEPTTDAKERADLIAYLSQATAAAK